MTPYPNAGRNVPPVTPFPTSIANGATYDSGIIQSQGANISVWLQLTQNVTLHIIQYADPAGNFVVQDTNEGTITANTVTNKVINDGKLFTYFKITIANASGSPAVVTHAAILQ